MTTSTLSIIRRHFLTITTLIVVALSLPVTGWAQTSVDNEANTAISTLPELGSFSVSLAVSDLNASLAFYQKLGFKQIGGDTAANWVILERDGTQIGLFEGMFEQNILTFNPDDVRSIQKQVKKSGIAPVSEADESTEGAAHMILQDPDGNLILFDQFE